MREDFLHFLWRLRRFDTQNLSTTDGQTLEIVHPGSLNSHSGPDFFNARLRIGGIEWAGNVEMHLRSSDWYRHEHQNDSVYDTILLHVVWTHDRDVFRTDGSLVPCLVMEGRVSEGIQKRYRQWMSEEAWIPCREVFGEVPEFLRLNWLDRVAVERLEEKTESVQATFEACEQHWAETLYRTVARSFGLKENTAPFEALTRSLPFSILAKHADQTLQVEALLFGQAGLLEQKTEESDAYFLALVKEYQFLRHKYQLTPISGDQWKFLRMRPANFPTIRLAQFAALIGSRALHPDRVLSLSKLKEVENLFSATVSDFWLTHYVFGKKSVARSKALGGTFFQLLTINALVPFLFFYGKSKSETEYCDRALHLLETLPPESNSILDAWGDLGVSCKNALHSQALLHQKKHYCDKKQCLNCGIGQVLLNN